MFYIRILDETQFLSKLLSSSLLLSYFKVFCRLHCNHFLGVRNMLFLIQTLLHKFLVINLVNWSSPRLTNPSRTHSNNACNSPLTSQTMDFTRHITLQKRDEHLLETGAATIIDSPHTATYLVSKLALTVSLSIPTEGSTYRFIYLFTIVAREK